MDRSALVLDENPNVPVRLQVLGQLLLRAPGGRFLHFFRHRGQASQPPCQRASSVLLVFFWPSSSRVTTCPSRCLCDVCNQCTVDDNDSTYPIGGLALAAVSLRSASVGL